MKNARFSFWLHWNSGRLFYVAISLGLVLATLCAFVSLPAYAIDAVEKPARKSAGKKSDKKSEKNADKAVEEEEPAPVVAPPGGLFDAPVDVKISYEQAPNAEIRYTLDGSEPRPTSPVYEPDRLRIPQNSVLKARAFVDGKGQGGVASAKFLIGRAPLVSSPPLKSVRLAGRLGARHAGNVAYLLYLHDENQPWIRSYDGVNELGPGLPMNKKGRDFMLDFFKDKSSSNPQGWEGEYAGKWLDAASGMVANAPPSAPGLADLAAKTKVFADDLRATQDADGYAGVELPATRYGPWDLWNEWYFLHGNLNQYETLGVTAGLDAAERNGVFIRKNYQPQGRNSILGGAWDGATTDVLDQLMRLYRHTGNTRYLDMGAHISSSFSRVTAMRKTGKLLIDKSHAYVVSAYLAGMASYNQLSGEVKDLEWIYSVWKDIVDNHLFAEYGIGLGECFAEPAAYSVGTGPETCATMEWLHFTDILYQITGDVRYAHQIENSIYNALLAAQSTDGMKWCYHTAVQRQGGKDWFHPSMWYGSVNCCFYSGPRAISNLPSYVYRIDPEGVRVDLYEQGEVKGLKVKGFTLDIAQTTSYPAEGKVRLDLKLSKPLAFKLKLRLPEWAANPVLSVNGKPATGVSLVPGTYAAIDRTWKKGDAVELSFDMGVQLRRNANMKNIAGYAIQRGPEILSLDSRDNPGLDLGSVALPDGTPPALTALPPAGDGRRLYKCKAIVRGSPGEVVLTSYADAGNSGANYQTLFQVIGK